MQKQCNQMQHLLKRTNNVKKLGMLLGVGWDGMGCDDVRWRGEKWGGVGCCQHSEKPMLFYNQNITKVVIS